MELKEFKNKLDSREFWGCNSGEMGEASREWEREANKTNELIKWSWDCGFKLDYDGTICSISSRFYPPHKSSKEYGKYHGTISLMIGGSKECIYKYKVEADTLDELKIVVEDSVSKLIEKVTESLKQSFKNYK